HRVEDLRGARSGRASERHLACRAAAPGIRQYHPAQSRLFIVALGLSCRSRPAGTEEELTLAPSKAPQSITESYPDAAICRVCRDSHCKMIGTLANICRNLGCHPELYNPRRLFRLRHRSPELQHHLELYS